MSDKARSAANALLNGMGFDLRTNKPVQMPPSCHTCPSYRGATYLLKWRGLEVGIKACEVHGNEIRDFLKTDPRGS